MTRKRAARNGQQHLFDFRHWGGPRAGAGRKSAGARPGVPHRARAPLASRHPVHVTVRVARGLPSMRLSPTRRSLVEALRAGRERFGFRLNHFSIQRDHLHLIAEASDRRALSRGLQGLLVRAARSLNRTWARRGRVFSDRYHDRILRTPREVRNALAYVLHNGRKHGVHLGPGPDPCSSGPWFDGWRGRRRTASVHDEHDRASPVVLPRTWLQRIGWRRHGLVTLTEVPGRT